MRTATRGTRGRHSSEQSIGRWLRNLKVAYDLAIGGATIVSHLLRIRVDRQDGVRFASIAQAPR